MSPRLLSLLSAVSLAACAGGSWTVKTTGLDGKTTVKGDPESIARHEAQQKAQDDYASAIAAAPRRGATDPIEVVVFEPSVSEDLKKALNAQQASDTIVRELSAEPLFRVKKVGGVKDGFGRPPTSMDGYIQAAGTAGDVYVWPHLMLEDAVGRAGNGKLVAAKAFTLKAEVVSAYGTGRKEPSARGNVFQNVQVLKEGSQRVRSAILQDLGPGLPSREAVASIQKSQRDAQMQAVQQQAGINPEDDAGTRLRKLLMMNQKQEPAKEPAAK
jgi:hypothetical protein